MTQHSENQYDDLTVGMDENESFSTDSINLFEFSGDEESPIARLKAIILSIDWEITDKILQELEEELLDLNDVWAGDKIKQVYIQGLDKIGKYIYKEKANAHPNAIKLLLTFYYNLEKIVSSEEIISEEEKKKILLEDVKKFDQLKGQITESGPQSTAQETVEKQPAASEARSEQENESELKALKGLVLGIDWEINDQDLGKLSEEVGRLEGVFSQSKAKLILLQGIGVLGSYIGKKGSQSNSNAFTLLHSFYSTLEKISLTEISGEEEKEILLAEVEKFNAFKAEISGEKSATPAGISDAKADSERGELSPAAESPVPAFSGDESGETTVQDDNSLKVASDVEARLSSVFGDEFEEQQESAASEESALAGIDVETEADDDSDEEALPYTDGTIAPALADVKQESSFSVDSLADELAGSKEDAGLEPEEPAEDVLQGVEVETEADDDSEEEALPLQEGALAPALLGSDEELGLDEEHTAAEFGETDSGDLEDRLESFFSDEIESSSEEWSSKEEKESTEESVDDESVVAAVSDVYEDEGQTLFVAEDVSEELSFLDEEVPAPALEESDEHPLAEDVVTAEDVSEELSFLDEEPAPALEETDEYPAAADVETEEEVSEGLSFLDEEPALALEETDEYPAAEDVVTAEEVSEELSFLDEEVPAPAHEEIDEHPAAADVVTEEEVSEGLSFLDEEPALALEETDEYPAAEDVVTEEDVSEELSFLDEEVPAPAHEEIGEHPAAEDEEIAEEVSQSLSFLDEDEVTAPIADETDEQAAEEGLIDETEPRPVDFAEEVSTGEEIQFTVPGEEVSDEAIESVSEEESGDDDIIEFIVPGEEFVTDQAPVSSDLQESEEVVFEAVDDDVEVDPLPGEDSDVLSSSNITAEEETVEFVEVVEEEPVSALDDEEDEQLFEDYAPELPGSSQVVAAVISQETDEEEQDLFSEESAESTDKTEALSEETLLQEEGEYDEYSPDLPGSQPDEDLLEQDGTDLFSEAEQEDQAEEVVAIAAETAEEEPVSPDFEPDTDTTEAVTGSDSDEFALLQSCVHSLQGEINGAGIQALFNAINVLRNQRNFTYTEKIFLQLLSSIGQHLETWETASRPASFQLLEKVFSALELSASAPPSTDQIQQQLLECTSQVLLLQQRNISSRESAGNGDETKDASAEMTADPITMEEVETQEVESSATSEKENALMTFVQQEMTQMRQIFHDEISMLRKELADRR